MSREDLILIIDDEVQIRRLLEITLQSNGFNICEAHSGREGINLAASHQPELIILDIGLPDISGHEVLKKLREWYTNPIIILSVQSNEEDIVKALDSGANDYLVKPFRTGELLARIRSALRSNNSSEDAKAVFSIAEIEIDLVARTVKKKNELIKLTVTEYKLAALFAQHAGKVLTHQYLLREVWGPGYINQSQYLRVFIAQLRKKIEDDPNRPVYIVTESGVGYRFTSQD
ncbi:MAG TPA: response regulator [Chitinophagaceae bacterium]|nr:response regulator [Chitinophagaceae bacterium]MBP7107943.1 response regulator [Chitinophagaceae bacterium]MBP7314039.1 response regulator [Chitinophagaceae bacterium]HQV55368.1 response regulator [Chitinophagaceae bacterium]HQX74633.1 response regulator [Chitinophagaceae bacterium]